jgi:16S rRNA (cytosine967-C5)-methyltransferase
MAETSRRDNVRARAARLLADVVERGRSLDRVLASVPDADRDRALLAELVIGSVRHWFSLNARIATLLHRPLDPGDVLLRCLLVIGAYQRLHTRIPPHAAVHETVAAARTIRRASAQGLVNFLMRALDATTPVTSPDEPARYDHPQWLIDRIRSQYPDDWRALLEVDIQRAPMSLRVNVRRISRDAFALRLASAGIATRPGLARSSLVLESPRPVAALPGFQEGLCTVQDEGAQLVVDVLDPREGERLLDACAAPGGKAGACLERVDVDLFALEVDGDRCATTRRELDRLGLEAVVVCGDATRRDWWDGRAFDRVLLDAPCSGTGTLRRHPDIKLLKRADDLVAYATLQRGLLEALWPVLAPSGLLVYCTCSILDEENDQVMAGFLAAHADADTASIDVDWGRRTPYGRMLLPSAGGPDGFYFAAVRKAERAR